MRQRLQQIIFLSCVLWVQPSLGSVSCVNFVSQGETVLKMSSDLVSALAADDFDGLKVMDYLFKDEKIKSLLDADAGVSEGYSIREHTQRVYDLFKEQLHYFGIGAFTTPENIDVVRLFKFFIAIHDIGKPEAGAVE